MPTVASHSLPRDPRGLLTRFAELADLIESKRDEIRAVLSRIESRETIEDEIFKSTDALRNAHIEAPHFGRVIGRAASFLPLNLPLYSLVIFGVIPSAVTRLIAVRAPTRLRGVLPELAQILELDVRFPSVLTTDEARDEFVRHHASEAELVIFTGKLANAQKLLPMLRKDVLFLFSGRGVNPIIVAEDADLDRAIEKIAYVKLFNSGQDCAAPDCILVHSSRARELVEGLRAILEEVSIGDYADPRVRVGSLIEGEQLVLAAKQLAEHRANIELGGRVDFLEGVVHPTIIFYPKFEKTNATELFSPVFFITEYETEEQLETYFATTQYRQNAMYVSLFGSSRVVETQRHSIVLRNSIVNEAERGNLEYGGYSLGASFVQWGKEVRSRPILVSREVSTHLAWMDKLGAHRPPAGHVLTEDSDDELYVHRVRGPLPGPSLLVVTGEGDQRSGAYACHRLLHELRSKRTRVDRGEITFVIPRSPSALTAARREALGAEADHVLGLRGLDEIGGETPFAAAREHDGAIELAKSLGLEEVRIDPEEAAEVSVHYGDDRDPSSSNVAYDVILNAARALEIIGGAPRPAAHVRVRRSDASDSTYAELAPIDIDGASQNDIISQEVPIEHARAVGG